MSTPENPPVATPAETQERLDIDRSTRGPVLAFFTSAVAWLLLSTVLGSIATFKMHSPEFLGDINWLTFGRVRPAANNAMLFGWATSAAFGVIIWLMARLCRTTLRCPSILITAWGLWNFGLTIGILGILGGGSTGVLWLELPPVAAILLFISYLLIAIWGVLMFRFRTTGAVFVSQWYILAALFWFPWTYGTGLLLVVFTPVSGSAQGLISQWVANSLIGLWLVPVGLAAAYYFIPKITGKPIHGYSLAALGFWTFAVLSAWNGTHIALNGPFPAWVTTVGIVASGLMVIPVLIVAINHYGTMQGSLAYLLSSPTLRFTFVGALAYTAAGLTGALLSFRSAGAIFDFTLMNTAHEQMLTYAFFTMVMFGAIYYILPRVVGYEWRSATLINLHFWTCFYGIFMLMIALHVGGIVQGFSLADPAINTETLVRRVVPLLIGWSLAGVFLTIAHIVFAYHFLLMLVNLGRPATATNLFTTPANVEAQEEPVSI